MLTSTVRMMMDGLHCTMLASEFIDSSYHFISAAEFFFNSLGISESCNYFFPLCWVMGTNIQQGKSPGFDQTATMFEGIL